MAKHEFGIMPDPPAEGVWYSEYVPEKYRCISVDDGLIEPLWSGSAPEVVLSAPTYYQTLSQPGYGLDYTGVTLIPPSSLDAFIGYFESIPQAAELTALMHRARRAGKFLIHFGI